MPLFRDQLEDIAFADLAEEARSLIPRLAPDWTDHNAHDPGITLVELLAWLTESDLYRARRVPEASYRAFLRLLGVEPRPAAAAQTILSVTAVTGAAITLPRGFQITNPGRSVVFQTMDELAVSPAQLAAVRVGAEPNIVDPFERPDLPPAPYLAFGPDAAAGCALYLGFDAPLQEAIQLYIWTPDPDADRLTRGRLIEEWQAIQQEAQEGDGRGIDAAAVSWREHYSARTTWEYFTVKGWAVLEDVVDETRGLTMTGPVRFRVPSGHMHGALDMDFFMIRCRWQSGEYECPPLIASVAHNTVAAQHAEDIPEFSPGYSSGRAGQVFGLGHAPILAGSTHLRVTAEGVDDASWKEAAMWDEVGPHDRAYQLLPEAGKIVFGDGRAGRVPPASAELHISCRAGGGPTGNLPAGALNQVLTVGAARVNIRQPFPATGGSPAETITDAKARAAASLVQRHRAITLADYEALALGTPGVPVGRVRAIADYLPDLPCFPALGSITVAVVPDCPGPRPEPGVDMLRAVRCYLERRRILTDELHVVSPRYTTVVVHAQLKSKPGSRPAAIRAQAQVALDAFFHPLHGGPDGVGWPIGRDVYLSEILALLNSLPDVAYVETCALRFGDEAEPRCENLTVCPDSLVESGAHQITVIKRSDPR